MFVASYRNTIAGARQIMPDPKPKRDKLIAMARGWQAAANHRQAAEALEAAAREQAALDRLRRPPQASTTPAREIIARVAAWHGLTPADIFARSRSEAAIAARFDAIAAVWTNCRLEGGKPRLLSMGRLFGRDHTSIFNALRKRGLK